MHLDEQFLKEYFLQNKQNVHFNVKHFGKVSYY